MGVGGGLGEVGLNPSTCFLSFPKGWEVLNNIISMFSNWSNSPSPHYGHWIFLFLVENVLKLILRRNKKLENLYHSNHHLTKVANYFYPLDMDMLSFVTFYFFVSTPLIERCGSVFLKHLLVQNLKKTKNIIYT